MKHFKHRSKSKTHALLFDCHFPAVHRPTLDAVLSYLDLNKVDGVVLGGDQLDLACISRHTKGKPIHRERGSLKRDLDGFDKEILTPIEKRLKRGAEKIWITGNHCRFEVDFIEEHPELEGIIDLVQYLRLKERGWKVIPLSGHYKIPGSKLYVIHGNQVGHSVTVARKAVGVWNCHVVFGHVHHYSAFTAQAPVHQKDRFTAVSLPCIGERNRDYAQGRGNAEQNGFGIVEVTRGVGHQLYPVVMNEGSFSFAGRVYTGKKKRCSKRSV